MFSNRRVNGVVLIFNKEIGKCPKISNTAFDTFFFLLFVYLVGWQGAVRSGCTLFVYAVLSETVVTILGHLL